jgi:hypothetical protein
MAPCALVDTIDEHTTMNRLRSGSALRWLLSCSTERLQFTPGNEDFVKVPAFWLLLQCTLLLLATLQTGSALHYGTPKCASIISAAFSPVYKLISPGILLVLILSQINFIECSCALCFSSILARSLCGGDGSWIQMI